MNLGGRGCGEPRSCHCIPAWAMRVKLRFKKKKKRKKDKEKEKEKEKEKRIQHNLSVIKWHSENHDSVNICYFQILGQSGT